MYLPTPRSIVGGQCTYSAVLCASEDRIMKKLCGILVCHRDRFASIRPGLEWQGHRLVASIALGQLVGTPARKTSSTNEASAQG